MSITELLTASVKQNASDLHLSAGVPAMIRVDGELRQLNESILTSDEVNHLIYQVMSEQQQKQFEQDLEIDFSFEVDELSRFRVNVFKQHRGDAAVFRVIPNQVSTLEGLDAPSLFKDIAEYSRGLVLVTGPTGSGKSTTLAAMVDYINTTRADHILTIEDPIEFIHKPQKSLINQRELHANTLGFDLALRSALREDPNVILIGELRDVETIRLALTAAETGHLVFATLHTASAPKSIDRIIDVFPAAEKSMIRSMLSESLRAVISQTLLKKKAGGRVAAHEIMIAIPAIRNLIREDKVPQMYSVMQTGMAHGMQTLDQHLRKLVTMGIISTEEAAKKSIDPKTF
ncbi:type IV pilus twitching motility protein PilT [Psychromonas algicola]|uniref:type IV pilus twitching motility protein PilT n=1 Tax=Psychromonas algicola TaxID=2555642 RepID=UPI0010674F58|nr:type IV pilus twitching motility protein PilT [Psychromonas sp. RZ5]TEW51277.1 type IV pilus twitching motility protein PilT [Psychromonas sp. RZ5]